MTVAAAVTSRGRAPRANIARRVANFLDRRFTAAGRLALVVASFGAAFGVDTTASLGSAVFTLGVALLAIGFVATYRTKPHVSIAREMGRLASVGVRFSYELVLTNTGMRRLDAVTMRDELADVVAIAPRKRWQAWRDRRHGRRWRRGGSIGEVQCPDVAPGASTRVTVSFTPERRGLIEFAQTLVFRAEPLGLARSYASVRAAGHLIVLPPRYPVRLFESSSGKRLQAGGVASAGSVGDAEEIIGLREYRPGDSRRRIAWKRTARVGFPVVREHEDEFFVRYGIVLDTYCANDTPDRDAVLDAATSVAASVATSLTAIAGARDALLDLVLVEDRVVRSQSGRGTGAVDALLEVIASAAPARVRDFRVFAAAACECASTATALVVILLDWDAARAALAKSLRATGSECCIIVMRAERDSALPEDALAAGVRPVRVDALAMDLAAL